MDHIADELDAMNPDLAPMPDVDRDAIRRLITDGHPMPASMAERLAAIWSGGAR